MLLLRHYIARCLKRYFESGAVVGSISRGGAVDATSAARKSTETEAVRNCQHAGVSTGIPISAMDGASSFRKWWQETQAQLGPGVWLTPSEVFHPHFGLAVLNHAKRVGARKVVEIGCGNGSVASVLLGHDGCPTNDTPVREACWNLVEYVSIEQSEALASKQRERLGHDSRFRVVQGSCTDRLVWDNALSTNSQQKTLIVALEVLDNLPHDRVVFVAATKRESDRIEDSWSESIIVDSDDPKSEVDNANRLSERLRPVGQDAIVLQCLDSYLHLRKTKNLQHSEIYRWMKSLFDLSVLMRLMFYNDPDIVYLPTGFCCMMNIIKEKFSSQPQSWSMLVADFDTLPDVQLSGKYAPLVAGSTKDFNNYIELQVRDGFADIIFPSDFDLIKSIVTTPAPQALVNEKTGRDFPESNAYDHYKIQSSSSFLRQNLSPSSLLQTTAKDGFNPLLSEFTNTKFLFSDNASE